MYDSSEACTVNRCVELICVGQKYISYKSQNNITTDT